MPRSDLWRRLIMLAMTCSIACCQGCGDPVDHLAKEVLNPLDPKAFHEAIDAVNRSGRGNDAASVLIRLLNDNNNSVRSRAARALGRVHADANLVVTALIEARKDESIRFYTTESLGEIGPIDNRVIEALILSLNDKSPRVRFAAVEAFVKIGPAGELAVPCAHRTPGR